MNVTESRFKNRQLHMEDYLQMVSAEQKEYAEVFDYSKIAEKSGGCTLRFFRFRNLTGWGVFRPSSLLR